MAVPRVVVTKSSGPATRIMARATTAELAQMRVGDFVVVQDEDDDDRVAKVVAIGAKEVTLEYVDAGRATAVTWDEIGDALIAASLVHYMAEQNKEPYDPILWENVDTLLDLRLLLSRLHKRHEVAA